MVRNKLSGLLLAATLSAAAQAAPDLVLHNGVLYTADGQRSLSEAMALNGDQITAVGSSENILALADESTRVVDLQERLVLPGLHDAHIHAVGIVRYEGCNLDSQPLDLAALSEFVGMCPAPEAGGG